MSDRAAGSERLGERRRDFVPVEQPEEIEFRIDIDAQRPGALDLLATVVSKWSGSRPHLEASRPAFYATLLRTEAHPKVAAVFKQHWPAAPVAA